MVRLRKELLSVPVAEGFHWSSEYASVYMYLKEKLKKKKNKREGRRRSNVRAETPRNVQVLSRTLYNCKRRGPIGREDMSTSPSEMHRATI